MNNVDLIITDINNKMSELLLDFAYDTFKYEYERNSSRSISFIAYMTSHNVDIYNLLQNESYIDYDNQRYVIKETDPKMTGNIHSNEITAHHIMFEFQNHFIGKDLLNEELNSEEHEEIETKYTLKQYLDYGFKDNVLGYTYEIIGEFNEAKTVDDIGGKNGIEHLNEGAELFNYIYFADNKKIYIFNELSFYRPSDIVIRHLYNTDETSVSINTNDLKTRIRGFGKKKTKSETKNYSPKKPADLSYSGTFIKEGTWRTENVGASFSCNVNCKWGNETITFKLKRMSKGGVMSLYLDNNKIGDYSCYSKTATSENIVLGTRLSKGTHTVKAVFNGKQDGVDYKNSNPCMYVGTKGASVINTTAVLKGTDVYHTVETYTSPNAKVFGIREAPEYTNDKALDSATLIEELKTQIQDEPLVDLSTNYIDTETINERDSIWFIHEIMQFDTELKVVSLTKQHPYMNAPDEIGFSNNRNDIIQIQQNINSKIKNVNKALDRSRINNLNNQGTDDYEIVGSVLIDG